MEFHIGDHVRCIRNRPSDNSSIVSGMEGVVCDISEYDPPIGVQWDALVSEGHNCHGNCPSGYGWYVEPGEIELVSSSFISFHIGDRVVLLVNDPENNDNLKAGDIGTVCDDSNPNRPGVCWGRSVSGHDCSGNCEYGQGWYVSTRVIEPAPDVDPNWVFDDEAFDHMLEFTDQT